MAYNYPEKSLEIQARLFGLGLKPDNLMMIGAFITVYGMFETTLERALWTLSEKDVAGERPFTEKMTTEAQFKMLAEGSPKLSEKCNSILKVAADAAIDLNDYRNSLVHGYLLSFGSEHTPMFMKNPRWFGEKRNKATGDAHIEKPFQDLVLIAVWSLFLVVQNVEKVFTEHASLQAIEDMKEDIDRARSYANEARHLSSLMNHEKY
ncbi:Uncharacterised protein [Shewanella putrefaciens]|uniref:hypothetical protein n=1 Tax=Shewanella putrefaciens TaxID=24 RepID=UPI000DFBE29B|nr:hypothetical protein [Shewanella putrefaciens]SUI79005.1 Uncharacterised protein [Shewanella putrefaciens]